MKGHFNKYERHRTNEQINRYIVTYYWLITIIYNNGNWAWEGVKGKMTFHIYLMVLWSITTVYWQIWSKNKSWGIKLVFLKVEGPTWPLEQSWRTKVTILPSKNSQSNMGLLGESIRFLFGVFVFLPLLWSVVVILPSFFNFMILPLTIHKSTRFYP